MIYNDRLFRLYRIPDSYMWPEEAPDSEIMNELGPFSIKDDEEEITFQVLSSVYEWFGIDPTYIPVTEQIEDQRKISEEKLKSI